MSANFNPQSTDAMFATILQKIEGQDSAYAKDGAELRSKLDTLLTETKGLGNRVQALENDRWYQRGVVAAIGVFLVSGFEWVKAKWFK